MQQLSGSLPVSAVPVRVTCGALVAYRYTYAHPRRRTSQDFYSSLNKSMKGRVLRAGQCVCVGLSFSLPLSSAYYFFS